MLQIVGVAEVSKLLKLATSLLLLLRRWRTVLLMAVKRSCRLRRIKLDMVSLEKIAVTDERLDHFASVHVVRSLTLDRSGTGLR